MTEEFDSELLGLTADIVAAHVSNNRVAANEVSELIGQVHAALSGLSNPQVVAEPELTPAVPVRSSVKHDFIVCLEDGKKLKMLKRYLYTNYKMTPDEYRAKWKLPRDYPMVAPAYAEQRRGLAQKIGLGRKKGEDEAPVAEAAPKPRAKKAAPAPTDISSETIDGATTDGATDGTTAPRKRGRPPKVKVAAEA